MASFPLTDARFYIDGRDLSADGNEIDIQQGVEVRDFTAFTKGTREFKPGLFTGQFTYRGFQNFGTDVVDDILRQKLGTPGVVIAAASEGGDVGERCVFFRTLSGLYKPVSGSIGEPFMFEVNGQLDGGHPVIGGNILEDAKTVRAATGSGAAFNLGAVGATQRLYAVLHAIVVPGTTLVVRVQSDDASGMLSPTTRITFATIATTITAEFATPLLGPITDTWWRADWTITGAGGYRFFVGMGIR